MHGRDEVRHSKESRAERVGSGILTAIVLIVITLVITWFLFGIVYNVGVGSPPSGNNAPPETTSVNIYQTISFSPWQGHDQYYPANFTVPTGVPVHFEIASYDNGTNYLPLGAGMIYGTTTGTETISGGAPGTPQGAVSTVPANDTTHTFTIKSGGVNLNIIVPPTANVAYPVDVSFTVVFPTAGTYTWFCQAPCDPYSMSTPGYMNGEITVE
jgi:heme/copper-type cytochrome/quinol oxidase subunit 2